MNLSAAKACGTTCTSLEPQLMLWLAHLEAAGLVPNCAPQVQLQTTACLPRPGADRWSPTPLSPTPWRSDCASTPWRVPRGPSQLSTRASSALAPSGRRAAFAVTVARLPN
eukprot:scaffold2357_cov399-Prasinococcus_capsulatus_cf.AAC.18